MAVEIQIGRKHLPITVYDTVNDSLKANFACMVTDKLRWQNRYWIWYYHRCNFIQTYYCFKAVVLFLSVISQETFHMQMYYVSSPDEF